MNTKVISIIGAGIIATGVAVYLLMPNESPIDLDNFTPEAGTPEAQVYTKLTQTSETYDIEKTVIAINAMESAMKMRQESLDDFMLQLAQDIDYEGVAPEILQAKARLIPIISELKKIEKEIGDRTIGSMVLSSFGDALYSKCEDRSLFYAVDQAFSFSLNPFSSSIGAIQKTAKEITSQGMDNFVDQYEEKKRLDNELDKVKEAYYSYLEGYIPLYKKYLEEWNNLCVMKDHVYTSIMERQWSDAYMNVESVLEAAPDDREALLLKALTLAYIGATNRNPEMNTIKVEIANSDTRFTANDTVIEDSYFRAANACLDQYMMLYGAEQSAPAEVIRGLIYSAMGETGKAKVQFDAADIHYPLQKAKLTELRDLYHMRARTLQQSETGNKLMFLHYSMMFGFDMFSPSLREAMMFEQMGDYQKAADKIYSHFHSRLETTQNVANPFYGIMEDLKYCQEMLPNSFNLQQLNSTFFELHTRDKEKGKLWGYNDLKKDQLDVIIRNNSGLTLSGANILICYRANDHKDFMRSDRQIQHIGSLEPGDSVVYRIQLPDEVENDKLSAVFAVISDDHGICWVPRRSDLINNLINATYGYKQVDPLMSDKDKYLAANHIDDASIIDILTRQTKIVNNKQDKKDLMDRVFGLFSSDDNPEVRYLEINLANSLAKANPFFSIGSIANDKSIVPYSCQRNGMIQLLASIPKELSKADKLELYMYSIYGDYRTVIAVSGADARIASCEKIK